MKIAEIYEDLVKKRVVSTKKAFSIEMLGKGWNYYSMAKESLSRDALVHLLITLRKKGQYALMDGVYQKLESSIEENGKLSRQRRSVVES